MNEWMNIWTNKWVNFYMRQTFIFSCLARWAGNKIQWQSNTNFMPHQCCLLRIMEQSGTVTKHENFHYLVLIMKQWQSIWDIKSMFYFRYRFWFSMCFYLLNSLIPYFTEVRLTEPKTKWLFLNSESQTFLIYFHRERKFWTLGFIER